jgi:hypothetical protein
VGFDTFVIIVSFINISWEPCRVTIEIFEIHNIVGATMATYVKILLDSFNLLNKVIAYIKNEGLNLNTSTFALIFVVFGFSLHLTCPLVSSCFGHVMSKTKFNMLLTTIKSMLDFQKLS